jgi:hypothetical protein
VTSTHAESSAPSVGGFKSYLSAGSIGSKAPCLESEWLCKNLFWNWSYWTYALTYAWCSRLECQSGSWEVVPFTKFFSLQGGQVWYWIVLGVWSHQNTTRFHHHPGNLIMSRLNSRSLYGCPFGTKVWQVGLFCIQVDSTYKRQTYWIPENSGTNLRRFLRPSAAYLKLLMIKN